MCGRRWLRGGGVCGGPCRAAGMSAEAADREAATSSRPCTPPQTSWFEFVLEEALLEQHLQKPSPGACSAGRRLPSGPARPRSPAPPGAGSFPGAVRRQRGLCCGAGESGAEGAGRCPRPCGGIYRSSNAGFLISLYPSYLITSFHCLSCLVDRFSFRVCECCVRKCCLFIR